MMRTCPVCKRIEHNDGYIICLDCGHELPCGNDYSSEDSDDGQFATLCPYCEIVLERCDESPLYGKSWLHPPTSCEASGKLFFEKQLERIKKLLADCQE